MAAATVLLASLGACSSLEGMFSSDKVDYRTAARQTQGLEVPPDLTQLARENRSQVQGGTVSAAALQQQQQQQGTGPAAKRGPAPNSQLAINAAGDAKLERAGDTRWVHSSLPVEQVWPQLRAFWQERGFQVASEKLELGVMETNWAENRAKLPMDIIRSTIGKVFDFAYSTGERDMYRARVERSAAGGTDIFIAHRGMQEIYTSSQRDQTTWQARPTDPLLEAEMLSRLLLKLGGKAEAAETTVATAEAPKPAIPPGPQFGARGRALSEVPDSLQVNEDFERAWRRVGQSLDRHGFTIEDRDRNQGLFYLRYADPNQAGKEEPNFFQRLFKGEQAQTNSRYRISVKTQGNVSTVSVLDDKGQQQTNEIAKRILNLLMDDLR